MYSVIFIPELRLVISRSRGITGDRIGHPGVNREETERRFNMRPIGGRGGGVHSRGTPGTVLGMS